MRGRQQPLGERFEEKYTPEPNSGCWLWTEGLMATGYGSIGNAGRTFYAHRVAYELYKGPIPQGLEIDHLCRVPSCVNPDHLEAVTHAENIRRGNWDNGNRAKTHCKNGHPFSGDNLDLSDPTRRRCIACRRAAQRRYWHRNKDKSHG